jgi:hypothetical protein
MPILRAYLRILAKKERRAATGIIAKDNIKGKIKSIENHKIASDPFGETAHHCAATKNPFKIRAIGTDKKRVRFIRLSASGYICFLSPNLLLKLILRLFHIIDNKEGLSMDFCCRKIFEIKNLFSIMFAKYNHPPRVWRPGRGDFSRPKS